MTALGDLIDRWLLVLVMALAGLGVAWPGPARMVVRDDGLNIALSLLVAAVGLGLPAAAVAQARTEWRRVLLAVVLGAAVLPALAWLAAWVVPAGPLRLGVLAAGVAPSEVAAVALTALAGGRVAVAAAVLVGSTALCVVTAGPVLHVLAGPGHGFSSVGLLASLLEIVAIPLALGALLRARLPQRFWPDADAVSTVLSSMAVLVLIWLVAGQAHLDVGYLRAAAALVLFIAASTAFGVLVGHGLAWPRTISLVLPLAMRDFAIAAGIATAAFGAPAAAALGMYGVLVLLLGAATARLAPRSIRLPA